MDWQELDRMIDRLEMLVNERTSSFMSSGEYYTSPTEFGGFSRNDWRPVWQQAAEVQAGFNSGVRYPARSEREQAWTRFNAMRNQASIAANAEREKFQRMSAYFRDQIVSLAQGAEYHLINDVMFFFDPTNINDMKQLAQQIKEAGRLLSENKTRMLREHKDECFELIQKVRASHDLFWEKRKRAQEVRSREYEERNTERLRRTEANLQKNREKRTKAEHALERVEAHISELREKAYSARSDEWRDRFETWLSEALDKRNDIVESITRLNEWIEQDQSRLSDIMSRGR